jgi:hypothetical protein
MPDNANQHEHLIRPGKTAYLTDQTQLHPSGSETRSGPSSTCFVKPWDIYVAAAALATTTIVSLLILIGNARKYTLSTDALRFVTENRATVQLLIQILSNILGLTCGAIVSILISYGTRYNLGQRPVKLEVLRLWHDLCMRNIRWSHPWKFLIPLVIFVVISAAPSAIWAGALTPVVTEVQRTSTILIPSYDNTDLIVEYPSEINSQGPTLRDAKGLFTYSVGVLMQGSLLASAASATPVDGSTRRHRKPDYSQYTYFGRSYGVAASVGLLDETTLIDKTTKSYTYEEDGYRTGVRCSYNVSSQYIITDLPGLEMLYAAQGKLPNSNEPEYSVMVGHTKDAIVSMGVGRNQTDPRRMVAIASGKSYQNLNSTQCTLEYVPTKFKVTVGLQERNITVTPVVELLAMPYQAFSSDANLTSVVTRQLEIISNAQTNLYVSLVGSSLNASIADYITAHDSASDQPISLPDATLRGLSSALAAMIDDMLVAYGSAQLMIAKQYTPVPAMFKSTAMRIGQNSYIYATLAINCVILILLMFEGIRTRGWTQVVVLEYSDPAALIVATSATTDIQNRAAEGCVEGKALLLQRGSVDKAKVRLERDMSLTLIL